MVDLESHKKLPLYDVARQYADARKDFRSFLEVAISYGWSISEYYDTLKGIWERAVEHRSSKIIPLP